MSSRSRTTLLPVGPFGFSDENLVRQELLPDAEKRIWRRESDGDSASGEGKVV